MSTALESPRAAPQPAASSAGLAVLSAIARAPFKLLWRLTRPIRRPMVAKFDDRIVRLVGADFRALSEQVDRLSLQVADANSRHLDAVREMNLFVEGLVREVARMQTQILTLTQLCAQQSPGERQPAPWRDAKQFTRVP